MVTAAQTTVTGSCGSACSGNPSVEVDYSAAADVGCPTGWTVYGGGGSDPYCGLVTTANTVLNATPLNLYTLCDAFVTAPQPNCSSETFNITINLLPLGTVLFAQNPQQCQCDDVEVVVNQKYYVTSSNFNSSPSYFGILGLLGAYQWTPSTVDQWCTSTVYPNLQNYGGIRILSYELPPKPSKMPGRYINGDVPSTLNISTGKIKPALIGAFFSTPRPTLINYSSAEKAPFPGNIYYWNNTDTQQRGPGGDPTTPCQGTSLP
jgi:hypothetical protein